MLVLPVLDLLGGHVVRGVGGCRAAYRPLAESRLVRSSEPMAVASAFRSQLGASHLYVADLDAIEREQRATATYRSLSALGLCLWLDAGVRNAADAEAMREAGAGVVVAGLETVASPAALQEMLAAVGADGLCFSLDLRGGEPIVGGPAWAGMSAEAIALAAADVGVRKMILLDLARVGANAGVGTQPLCRAVREQRPAVMVIAGGGVRSVEDLLALRDAGASAALVATALHDGRIGRAEIAQLAEPEPHG